jgi:hypothetical protein
MNDSSLFQLLMLGIGLYVAKLWWDDLRGFKRGQPSPKPLPGAVPATSQAILIAALGALALVGLETWGELKLGLSEQQTTMTALFAACTLTAAIVEEVIFRGFLVIENRGRALLWVGAFAASLVFALLHPHLWAWEESFHLTLDAKGWFSTGALFVGSLWFYFVRFAKFNLTRSLLPCFVAHGVKNLGVVAVKASQGFLVGWW